MILPPNYTTNKSIAQIEKTVKIIKWLLFPGALVSIIILWFIFAPSARAAVWQDWTQIYPERSYYPATFNGNTIIISSGFVPSLSRLYVTIDKGDTWIETTPAGSIEKNWRLTADTENIYAAITGEAGGLAYRSSDRGDTWTECGCPTSGCNFYGGGSTFVADSGNVIAASASRLWKSTDACASWTEVRPDGDNDWNWYNLSIFGNEILAGQREAFSLSKLYLSDDLGVGWSKIKPSGDDTNSDYYVSVGNELFVVAVAPTGVGLAHIYISDDRGTSWNIVYPDGPGEKVWNSCTSFNSTILCPETSSGRLYLSTDGGTTWVEEQPMGDIDEHWWGLDEANISVNLFAASGNTNDLHGFFIAEGEPLVSPDIAFYEPDFDEVIAQARINALGADAYYFTPHTFVSVTEFPLEYVDYEVEVYDQLTRTGLICKMSVQNSPNSLEGIYYGTSLNHKVDGDPDPCSNFEQGGYSVQGRARFEGENWGDWSDWLDFSVGETDFDPPLVCSDEPSFFSSCWWQNILTFLFQPSEESVNNLFAVVGSFSEKWPFSWFSDAYGAFIDAFDVGVEDLGDIEGGNPFGGDYPNAAWWADKLKMWYGAWAAPAFSAFIWIAAMVAVGNAGMRLLNIEFEEIEI